eukprot:Gb_36493 [translate_table: standard]
MGHMEANAGIMAMGIGMKVLSTSPLPPLALRHLHTLNNIKQCQSSIVSTLNPKWNAIQIQTRKSTSLKAMQQQQQCNVGTDESASPTVEHHQLIMEVKERLAREHEHLPVGRKRRDDEEMILWFLKDRKFNVDGAVCKLAKAIAWREEFGVDNLTEESLQNIASTGKAYLHKYPDVKGRPVVVVVAAKHLPARHDLLESEKLCVYLIEKALSQLLPGEEKLLGIFDLRGFTAQNGDLTFIKFLIDVFYDYYPKRIGQVLFVDAPFIFQPGWNLVKPWLKSYANLVRFCSASVVQEEYFMPETVPSDFRA